MLQHFNCKRPYCLQSLKYFLSGSFQKKFADLRSKKKKKLLTSELFSVWTDRNRVLKKKGMWQRWQSSSDPHLKAADDFPGGPVRWTHSTGSEDSPFPRQGEWVWSLVGKGLICHVASTTAKKKSCRKTLNYIKIWEIHQLSSKQFSDMILSFTKRRLGVNIKGMKQLIILMII